MNRNLLQLCLVIIISTAFSFSANSQTDTSNRGTEFWVGYGHHQFMESGPNSQDMVLYLSTGSQAATVTVTIDSSGATPATWWKKTYNIPANTAIQSDIIPKNLTQDFRLFNAAGSVGVFRGKAIHVESNVPIVAYAHIYGSASSGATMLVPVEAWGGLYTSVNSKQSYAANCFSWCYVIAKYDNTVIEITPSVKTRAQNMTGLQQGVTSTVTLMKGQIYQILGANLGSDANGNGASSNDGYELTGTKIKSVLSPTGYVHPIAVFSGSSRTSNAAACGSGGGDNDMQQHFPRQAWGRKYLTSPNSASQSADLYMTNTYKIVVTDPTTVVKRNGVVLTSLVNNLYYTYESNTADYIEADQPILVAQFMTGGNCLGYSSNLGDPEMFYLSPISQSIKDATFYRNTKENITMNYVNIIIPTAGVPALTIDGSSVFTHTYAHPNLPGYTVVVQKWNPSAMAQCVVHSDSAFTGMTYGLGSVESYGYNLGCHLNAVNARDASVLPPGFTGEIPLPVTLISFSGKKKEADAVLQWATSSEVNFDHFEVERSLNGNEFAGIGIVRSKQTSSAFYDFTDANVFPSYTTSKMLYYRLKMVDNDGRQSYSKIITLRPDSKPLEILLSPNPFTHQVKVAVTSEIQGRVQVVVRDLSGRVVLTKTASIHQGYQTIDIGNLDALQKGVYMVEVEINGNKYYSKLMK